MVAAKETCLDKKLVFQDLSLSTTFQGHVLDTR